MIDPHEWPRFPTKDALRRLLRQWRLVNGIGKQLDRAAADIIFVIFGLAEERGLTRQDVQDFKEAVSFFEKSIPDLARLAEETHGLARAMRAGDFPS